MRTNQLLIVWSRYPTWISLLILIGLMMISCTSYDPRLHLNDEAESSFDDIQIRETFSDNGLKKVTLSFINVSENDMFVKYRFTWLDASGIPSEGILSRPAVKNIGSEENQLFSISGIAPNDQVVDWRLNVAAIEK